MTGFKMICSCYNTFLILLITGVIPLFLGFYFLIDIFHNCRILWKVNILLFAFTDICFVKITFDLSKMAKILLLLQYQCIQVTNKDLSPSLCKMGHFFF